MRGIAALAALLVIGGCVTTETGDGPKAGTQQQRLQAYLELARGYLEKRDFANARRPLENALKVDPSSGEAHVLMAILNQEEACLCYTTFAIVLEPC